MIPNTDLRTGKPLSECPIYLRLLADWFDVEYPDDDIPEVQNDLRHWADIIERLVGGV